MPESSSAYREPASGQLVLVDTYAGTAAAVLSTRQRRDRLLLGVFVAVMVVTAAYNFLIATPRYASQFSFVVRSATPAQDRFSFMNFSASGESSDNANAIMAYLGSRDLVALINRDGLISHIFGAPVVDMFAAFPSVLAGSSQEYLYRHFQHYVDAEYDEKSNISYVEVQAFAASDARKLAERMCRAAEDKVNTLNARARLGMTATAEREVVAARGDLARILTQQKVARDRGRVIDPKLQADAAVKVASDLAENLAAIEVELDQTRRAAPTNLSIGQLVARRDALRQELARQNAAMAGGTNSLADRIQGSEALAVSLDTAGKRLLGASLALANARTNADRNRLYLERISQPSLPDEPRYPRRTRNILLVAALSIALLWIFRSLSELLFDADE